MNCEFSEALVREFEQDKIFNNFQQLRKPKKT
jgi:hypothetical protein